MWWATKKTAIACVILGHLWPLAHREAPLPAWHWDFHLIAHYSTVRYSCSSLHFHFTYILLAHSLMHFLHILCPFVISWLPHVLHVKCTIRLAPRMSTHIMWESIPCLSLGLSDSASAVVSQFYSFSSGFTFLFIFIIQCSADRCLGWLQFSANANRSTVNLEVWQWP